MNVANDRYENGRALAVVDATAVPAVAVEYGAIVEPLVTPEAASAAIDRYEKLKTAIVRDGDMVRDKKGRTFLKKAFWRRVARCFGLSVELVSEQRVVEEDGTIRYSVTYRAVAPNGQSMEGDGLCDSIEFGPTEHNVRAKAHTRAKNRAISDLVGGGEVSAEELPDDDYEQSARGGRGGGSVRQRISEGEFDRVPTAAELKARLLATGDPDKLTLQWAKWWNETRGEVGRLLARVEKREAEYRGWVKRLRDRAYDAQIVSDEEGWGDICAAATDKNDLASFTYSDWKKVEFTVEQIIAQGPAVADGDVEGDEHRLEELEPVGGRLQ